MYIYTAVYALCTCYTHHKFLVQLRVLLKVGVPVVEHQWRRQREPFLKRVARRCDESEKQEYYATKKHTHTHMHIHKNKNKKNNKKMEANTKNEKDIK